MKNPLMKRLPRELKKEWKKYVVLILLMVFMIALASGVDVANSSMMDAIEESYTTYNIEHGHFEVKDAPTEALENAMPDDITVFEQFYKDMSEDIDCDGKEDATVRIFKIRETVNTACVRDGRLPEKEHEIAIDARHAGNNKIKVGNVMKLDGTEYEVTGLIASPDYTSLYKNNSDFMFNALDFNIAVVTEDAWNAIKSKTVFQYAFQYKEKPADAKAQKKAADELMGRLAVSVAMAGNELTDFVPEYANQAIHFAPDDMGSDKAVMSVMVYIFIGVLAFIFAITTSNTIVNESAVIGTLRATGYSRSEIARHYLVLPVAVTLIASVLGNILGYTFFKDVAVNLYYDSYSLMNYETHWNAKAFVVTTLIPLVLMALVNFLVIYRKLRLSPLRFLRRDLSTSKRKKAVKLPNWKFLKRFRLRVLLNNVGGYLVLFFGIFFVMLLLAFCISLPETIDHYQSNVDANILANYQYVLRGDHDPNGSVITTNEGTAEKFSMAGLQTIDGPHKGEDITVYGYSANSRFIHIDAALQGNEVYVSSPYASKFHLHEGDTIELSEKYEDQTYTFTVKGVYEYNGNLCIFLPRENYNTTFALETGAFTGYMAENEITDIPDNYIYTTITSEGITAIASQLDHSIGGILDICSYVCLIMGLLVMYLLTKIIIEKNSTSISMLKVLGYKDKEIDGIFILLTSLVVVASSVACAFLSMWGVNVTFELFLSSMNGWFDAYISPLGFIQMIATLLIAYAFVAYFDTRRIKKVPLSDALKNVE